MKNRIKNIFRFTAVTAIGLMVASCTSELNDDGFVGGNTEQIDAFNVQWRAYLSAEQQQVLQSIISDMVRVEGGTFMMGCRQDQDADAKPDEAPVHFVRLSDFYICAHELTYDQVETLLSVPQTRADVNAATGKKMTDQESNEDDVANIKKYQGKDLYWTWEEWNYILRLMQEYTGLEFTFPTEAQWEYAARGGNQSQGYRYPGSNALKDVWSANIDETNHSRPNELGLYNMADKQGEWCLDAYAPYTDETLQVDPCTTVGKDHVVRGGSHAGTRFTDEWDKNRAYYGYIHKDIRMIRSTARAYDSHSRYVGCRPVINITFQP